MLHLDRILTGTMEAVEDAGAQFKHSFWKPVQRASALVQGIKVGLDLLRSRKSTGFCCRPGLTSRITWYWLSCVNITETSRCPKES